MNTDETKQASSKKTTVTKASAPKVGDQVIYVLPDGSYPGDERPAVVVRVWGDKPDSLVNLQVFTDSVNDYITAHPGASGLLWATSVHNDESEKKPGTYHRSA